MMTANIVYGVVHVLAFLVAHAQCETNEERISRLETTVELLTTKTIGDLKSENERLSLSYEKIASENEFLKSRVEELEHKLMFEDRVKSFPSSGPELKLQEKRKFCFSSMDYLVRKRACGSQIYLLFN